MIWYKRLNENQCICNICNWGFVLNDKYDERELHYHESTRPVNRSLIKTIVWRGSQYLLFVAEKCYTEKLVKDMRMIANGLLDSKNAGIDFTALDTENAVIYCLAKIVSQSKFSLVGYIALNYASYDDTSPMVRQIFVMPKFRGRGCGAFLLLKGLEQFGENWFVFDDFTNDFSALLARLKNRGYLVRKRYGHEIIKRPTPRMMRA